MLNYHNNVSYNKQYIIFILNNIDITVGDWTVIMNYTPHMYYQWYYNVCGLMNDI